MGWGTLRKARLGAGRLAWTRARVAFAALCTSILLSAPAHAQMSDTEVAPAAAVVLQSAQVVNNARMDFGDIIRPAAAATVTMTPAASATCTPSAGLVRTGPCTAAAFALMGRKNWILRIREMNGGTIQLTRVGGTQTMTITNLSFAGTDMTAEPGGGNPPGTFGRFRITNDSGIANFYIGGRLNVGANQAIGHYTGTLDVQVLFN